MGSKLQRRGILLCLVGPAGGGKTSHGEQLLRENPDSLSYSVSVTSRPARTMEKDGVHYFFISREEFSKRRAAGDFFESEEVHGNYYGTLRSTLIDSVEKGRDLLLDVDIRGALTLKKEYPNETVIVFLVPPDAATLRERVTTRAAITPEELRVRLDTARTEYSTLFTSLQEGEGIDYFIVNDERSRAYECLCSILRAERCRLGRMREEDLRRICVV